MPRYRIKFSKQGAARFISHLDLVRTFERAMRRAGLPLVFSQGFNPHPRFSFAAPLPVGVAGEQEYLDLELVEAWPADAVARRLAACLPEGLTVAGACPVPGHAPALMASVQRADYRVHVQLKEALTPEQLDECLHCLLSLPEVTVIRKTREGKEKFYDIRPGIFNLTGRIDGPEVLLAMTLQAGSGGNVRPEEVIAALAGKCGLPVLPGALEIVRTGLLLAGDETIA
ncbi:TIGR03936 family radical SAM-associated protein [Desulfotomaculum copahuensis]|uniref:DUF2344 domain-containing protein n=1 Tax=Desulfotomaculum copahuensis TaxID=1838280 RepID=A0A1B7LH93_9FIRM|nr:TIGR03936 family radical SAM-associated protein [Desulfotomaculum copahuensis]OAT85570.1 hypothetical protein A6M21_05470 [Desulfotomaculum copahuensis]